MKSFFINWKTAWAGVLAIASALGSIASMAKSNTWDMAALGVATSGIAAGFGLIFAKDANVTGGTTPQDGGTIPAGRP
jgi:hypothetical protein